jgi:hypothetical protein
LCAIRGNIASAEFYLSQFTKEVFVLAHEEKIVDTPLAERDKNDLTPFDVALQLENEKLCQLFATCGEQTKIEQNKIEKQAWLLVDKDSDDVETKKEQSFIYSFYDRLKIWKKPPSTPSKITLTHYDLEQQSIFDHVRNQGYSIEKHETMTSDGFVLQLFRIGHEANVRKPIVFLQHGVCNSGSTWVVTGTKQGLAYDFIQVLMK